MKVIDMHTHIFPDKVAEKATSAIADFFPMPEPTHHHGRTSELNEVLELAGIDYAMVFSAATTPHQVEHIHRFVCAEAEKYPRFIPCGTLHPAYTGYREELAWLREHHVHGIKLHPEMQNILLDDPRLFPMFEEMERNDMFLIAHMGDPRTDLSGPRHMIPILEEFPRLRCIACHLGSWGDWRPEKIRELVKYPNVYTDISSSFSYISDPAKHGPVYEMLASYDPTHVFYGSDYPIWCPRYELEKALRLDIPREFLEDILFNNFAAFYHYRKL